MKERRDEQFLRQRERRKYKTTREIDGKRAIFAISIILCLLLVIVNWASIINTIISISKSIFIFLAELITVSLFVVLTIYLVIRIIFPDFKRRRRR